MKRTYMKPEMEAYKITAESLICLSGGDMLGNGGSNQGKGGIQSDAPMMPDFFEEDDFITWE